MPTMLEIVTAAVKEAIINDGSEPGIWAQDKADHVIRIDGELYVDIIARAAMDATIAAMKDNTTL